MSDHWLKHQLLDLEHHTPEMQITDKETNTEVL
jgi:hypothetical protein